MRVSRWWVTLAGCVLTVTAWGQTFGRVVAIGGHSSDLALDESRRVVYVANYTANRVDVIGMDSESLERSFNVASQPSSLAVSPDAQFLVVGHYGHFESPHSPRNALTVINLGTHARQTHALADPPFGVAFGRDGKALVVTSTQFILFNPNSGTMQVIDTVAGVTAKTLPQPPVTFPTQIIGASLAASADGLRIVGVTDTLVFLHDVGSSFVRSGGYVAAPPLGPRAISVAHDGSYLLAGWALFDQHGILAQFSNPSGKLEIGSHAIDSARGMIYAQIPESPRDGGEPEGGSSARDLPRTNGEATDPILLVADADNLTVRERLRLPENLAGKAHLSADGSTMYALSESGIVILPVGLLHLAGRLVTDREDLVFRSSFCTQEVVEQEFTVFDPGGGNTGFAIESPHPAIKVSHTAGVAPATVRVTVDPSAFQNVRGTVALALRISSQEAVNVINPVRLLIHLHDPDQRGTLVNAPGRLVDLIADPFNNRFFVLRQDTNEALVFDGSSYELLARLRTGNTPTSMAVTHDRRHLLIGNDNSQIANVYDLETLEPQQPIRFPAGHYPRFLAASGRAILAASRVAGPKHTIDRVDFSTRTATELPTLGVYENNIDLNTALVASANGSSILIAQADGNVMLYNANSDTIAASRRDFEALEGAFAASVFDEYVVGGHLLNASLVPVRRFDGAVEKSSGFAFVDDLGFRTGVTEAGGNGVIEKVDLLSGDSIRSTRIADAPLTGREGARFTRTLAVLPDRSALVNLTAAGFTILGWNYDASVAIPRIDRVVNAADRTRSAAPGGLIIVEGRDLSAVNLASQEMPLPLALGESCLTVNGLAVPMLMVSPTQINAQLPFQAEGNVTMVLRTPGGVSDSFYLTLLPYAPSIFRTEIAPSHEVPMVVRKSNGQPVTPSNPVRWDDELVIYLTGMGRTTPAVAAGQPAPSDPQPVVLTEPRVEIAGKPLPVHFAGMTAGQIGVYEINVKVLRGTPKGFQQPLRVTQGGFTTTVLVRVVE